MRKKIEAEEAARRAAEEAEKERKKKELREAESKKAEESSRRAHFVPGSMQEEKEQEKDARLAAKVSAVSEEMKKEVANMPELVPRRSTRVISAAEAAYVSSEEFAELNRRLERAMTFAADAPPPLTTAPVTTTTKQSPPMVPFRSATFSSMPRTFIDDSYLTDLLQFTKQLKESSPPVRLLRSLVFCARSLSLSLSLLLLFSNSPPSFPLPLPLAPHLTLLCHNAIDPLSP